MIRVSIPNNYDTQRNKVQIKSCNDSMLWYNIFIGELFNVIRETSTEYWVRDNNGYSNFVYKQDCEIILKEETDVNTHG